MPLIKSKNSPYREAYVTPIKVPNFLMHNTTGKVGTIEEKITPWTSPTRSAKVLISGVVTMVATTNLILLAPVFRNISLLKASRVTFTIQNHIPGLKVQVIT